MGVGEERGEEARCSGEIPNQSKSSTRRHWGRTCCEKGREEGQGRGRREFKSCDVVPQATFIFGERLTCAGGRVARPYGDERGSDGTRLAPPLC